MLGSDLGSKDDLVSTEIVGNSLHSVGVGGDGWTTVGRES